MAIKLATGDISALYLGSTAVSAAYLGSTSVFSVGGGAFDPTTISGLELWYDASDSSTLFDATSGGSLVAADGVVARWEDKSGNSRHATASSNGPARKVATQNGLDTLLFDGTDDGLVFSAFAIPSSYTIFWVFERATSGIRSLLFTGGDSNRYAGNWNTANGYNTKSNDTYADVGGADASTGFFCVTEMRTGTSSISVRKNGAAFATVTSGAAVTSPASASWDAIGRGYTFHNGHKGEVLVYNSALSATDRDAVEAYLLAKWGIA